jgi:hypothetical protein
MVNSVRIFCLNSKQYTQYTYCTQAPFDIAIRNEKMCRYGIHTYDGVASFDFGCGVLECRDQDHSNHT